MSPNAIIGILGLSFVLALFGQPVLNYIQSQNDLKRDYADLQQDYRELEIKFQAYREGNTAN